MVVGVNVEVVAAVVFIFVVVEVAVEFLVLTSVIVVRFGDFGVAALELESGMLLGLGLFTPGQTFARATTELFNLPRL